MKDKNGRTALYRHYGDNDLLLYVGISLSATTRLAQHCAASPWGEDIKRVSIEYFDTRKLAMEAERNAVIFERPLFNKDYFKHKYRIPDNIPFDKFEKIMEAESKENYYFAFPNYKALVAFIKGYKEYQILKKRKQRRSSSRNYSATTARQALCA